MTVHPTAAKGQSLFARDLGSRGSRTDVASADPAGELTPTATAILAAIPSWWTAQAAAAGLSGAWLDVRQAVDVQALVNSGADTALDSSWGALSAEGVGQAYVSALA